MGEAAGGARASETAARSILRDVSVKKVKISGGGGCAKSCDGSRRPRHRERVSYLNWKDSDRTCESPDSHVRSVVILAANPGDRTLIDITVGITEEERAGMLAFGRAAVEAWGPPGTLAAPGD